eukprot:s4611_g4.t1
MLHACAANHRQPGMYELAQLLIQKKSDLNAGDSEGDTPLAHARLLACVEHYFRCRNNGKRVLVKGYFHAPDLYKLYSGHGGNVAGPFYSRWNGHGPAALYQHFGPIFALGARLEEEELPRRRYRGHPRATPEVPAGGKGAPSAQSASAQAVRRVGVRAIPLGRRARRGARCDTSGKWEEGIVFYGLGISRKSPVFPRWPSELMLNLMDGPVCGVGKMTEYLCSSQAARGQKLQKHCPLRAVEGRCLLYPPNVDEPRASMALLSNLSLSLLRDKPAKGKADGAPEKVLSYLS